MDKLHTSIRTQYPWAVVNQDQIVIEVFNYRAEAKNFVAMDKAHRKAFDASGCIFVEVKP